MNYFYSAANNAFYAEALQTLYERAGTWPDDAIKIAPELYSQLMAGQESGKTVIVARNGKPVLTGNSAVPDTELPEQS